MTAVPAHLAAAGRALLAAGRGRSSVPGAVVLAYHDVVADDAPVTPYAVTLSRLRSHLDVVARLGLTVVSLRELSASACSAGSLDGRVAVVFDDALVGVHHLALPELAARGWPSTLHPVAERLGVDPPWWPGSQRTMSWAELSECVGSGVDLGAHGVTHTCLTSLGDAQLAEELRVPRWRFESMIGRRVDELAYPFGHHDARVREAAVAAGFLTAYSFTNGRVTAANLLRLPRLTMHQGLTRAKLLHQLSRLQGDWPGEEAIGPHEHDLNPTVGAGPVRRPPPSAPVTAPRPPDPGQPG